MKLPLFFAKKTTTTTKSLLREPLISDEFELTSPKFNMIYLKNDGTKRKKRRFRAWKSHRFFRVPDVELQGFKSMWGSPGWAMERVELRSEKAV